ncbi:SphA family protein [Paracoccus ravus]|uniref:SphA family protein n=1 Tax=Paracoccus ravus TaxID=2447760 RepID=UPI00106E2E55|nr:transporter [Paracoccus ravus]
MRRLQRNSLTYLLAAGALAGFGGQAWAVEGGAGMYILGSKTTMAGAVPPPGTYTQQTFYYYSGENGGSIPQGGRLEVGIDGEAFIGLSSVIWSGDGSAMGGRPFFGLTLPWGYKESNVDATLTAPNGAVLSANKSQDSFTFGDPVLSGGLGWGQGPVMGSLTLMVNVPVGDYDQARSTNVAFNHWAYDLTGAVTWMNPDTGWQANLAAGVTFNDENDDTEYESGDEFHLEAAVGKTLANGVMLGLQGYYYKQISDDTGAGTFGPFRGEVTALGPAVSWQGNWWETPVTLEARWFHEFDATNRLEGDAILFNMTIPLGGKS